jgi:integrase
MDQPGDPISTIDSAPGSKRLNRRMRDAGLGASKVFHSLRHTFKGMRRRTTWFPQRELRRPEG